ncbi:Exocyst complex component EXO70A3 [Cardamine amara subsp. amara]|uniref:Exocyst subunit Exo70 family protein n=1 Tax=Cardamine amara subsp. amara TaxID=228776 RepID=A0ABD1AHQ7_CARAN
MSHVLHKSDLHDLSNARKFPTHDHLLYSTTKSGPCARCFEEIKEQFYECSECNIFFHKECIESTTEINSHKDIGEVRALEDKLNDETIKVEEIGKVNARFTDELHLVLHKDGKIDDINTRYDACKFKQILENNSKPIEPDHLFECLPSNLRPSSEVEDSGEKSHDPRHKGLEKYVFTVPTIISPMVLPLLHDLAQQMVEAGHQQQVLTTYRDTRKAVLEQSLEKLGVERLSEDDVQRMKWYDLDGKITKWIHYMRISVKLLFATEKIICNQILDGVDSVVRDQCFAEITTNSFDMLLSFGYAVPKSKRSPETQFVMLDMYEIMTELQPEFELIFGSKPFTEMKESTLKLTKLLAQTVQETIADFVTLVEMDATEGAVMDGSVHLICSYVVKYFKYLFDYQSTLGVIFQEFDNKDLDNELKFAITRIIRALLKNLDGKSKQFQDAALTQLFLMNNVYYVVKYVTRTEAGSMLGDDWVQTHRKIVQQHAKQYKTISWNKILQCLTVQSSGSDPIENETITTTLVKDKFKTFNSQFEELHHRQCQWTVPDIELRESLILAIADDILPAYRSFLKRFGPMIESGKNPQKYIRFTPEELERMLDDFFEGKNLE